MASKSPQTIASDLIKRVNDLLQAGNFLDGNSFNVKSLLQEADKLIKIDPTKGHVAKAAIYQISNSELKMRDHFRIARQYTNNSDISVYSDNAIGLANLGYFSEAQDLFTQFDLINYLTIQNIERTFEVGYQILAFSHLESWIDKAKKLALPITENNMVLTSKTVAILNKNNISDKLLSQYADIAGEVLRENKLMMQDKTPNFEVAEEENGWFPATIFITFKVNVDHLTAARLYKELTKRLIAKFEDIPDAIHISIESSL